MAAPLLNTLRTPHARRLPLVLALQAALALALLPRPPPAALPALGLLLRLLAVDGVPQARAFVMLSIGAHLADAAAAPAAGLAALLVGSVRACFFPLVAHQVKRSPLSYSRICQPT